MGRGELGIEAGTRSAALSGGRRSDRSAEGNLEDLGWGVQRTIHLLYCTQTSTKKMPLTPVHHFSFDNDAHRVTQAIWPEELRGEMARAGVLSNFW